MYTCKYFPIYLIACLISILCLDACGGNSSKSGKSISDSDSIGNDIMQGENHAIQYNIIKNKIPYNIVNHIGSSAISVMFADTIQFNSNNIYKVTHYRFDETNRKHLLSETQYLPDGRIQEKKDYENDEIQFHKKYYFDKDFNKLILEENIQHAYQRNIYSWLFYDDNSNLTEEFDYETNLQKKNVRFW